MINDIEVETGQTCELPRGITSEEAQENADVQKIIAPRLVKIREISEMFLKVIIDSLEIVPYGIRWISKQIRKLTKVSSSSSSSSSSSYGLSLVYTVLPKNLFAKKAKISGCQPLCRWIIDRFFLHAPLHQSCDCHTSSIYAG